MLHSISHRPACVQVQGLSSTSCAMTPPFITKRDGPCATRGGRVSGGLLDIDAAAFFSPSGSWARLDGKTPELLTHEQGHFDMAELYALRLRKAIQDAKIGCEDTAKANAAGERIVGEFQRNVSFRQACAQEWAHRLAYCWEEWRGRTLHCS